ESVDDLLAVPPEREAKLQELARVASAASSVILTTHVNADGDGAGSEAAMAAWLESVGVRCTIINPSPFPANFRFLLPRRGLAVDLADGRARGIIEEADL